jgi:hypothetical protein
MDWAAGCILLPPPPPDWVLPHQRECAIIVERLQSSTGCRWILSITKTNWECPGTLKLFLSSSGQIVGWYVTAATSYSRLLVLAYSSSVACSSGFFGYIALFDHFFLKSNGATIIILLSKGGYIMVILLYLACSIHVGGTMFYS